MNMQEMMEEAIKAEKKERKKRKTFMLKHKDEFIVIANGLIPVQKQMVRIIYDGSEALDISLAGNHKVFKTMWKALRDLGYNCNDKPKDKRFSSWSGYWTKNDTDLTIWVSFSSTVCTRKQVGTKMVEQAVYETVCE